MWNRIVKSILTVLLIASIFLRFYKLGSIPQGLNIDEASYGYDAYSLLKTGKDQWGKAWPINLKSFGDYKPAALSYAMIPFTYTLGLNTTSTRLPSAVAGLLILPVLFLILQALHKSTKTNLTLTLIFSLSPWFYGISRLFYEPNIGLLFFSLGLLNIIKYYQNNQTNNFLLAFVCLALSGYWYFAIRVTSTLLAGLIVLISIYMNRRLTKQVIISTLIYLILIVPLLLTSFSNEGLTRLRQESKGQDYANSLSINENRSMCYLSSGKNVLVGQLCAIWWNKPVARIEHIGQSMIYQLSSKYLFMDQTQSDILPKNTGPYIWILSPIYFLGWYVLASGLLKKKKSKSNIFILILATIILGNLPAAIAGSPMIHRNVIGIYMAFLLIAYGWWFLFEKIRLKWIRAIVYVIFLFAVVFQSTQFLIYYHAVYTKQQPSIWRYDSSEIFDYAISQENNYDVIWFQDFEDAPLYYAFHKTLNPTTFQQSVVRQEMRQDGWVHNDQIGKIKSTSLSLQELSCQHELAGSKSSELIITPNRGNILKSSIFHTMEFTKVHVMHEAYSLNTIIDQLKSSGWTISKNCQSQ